jgi:hypothetical protein
MGRTGLLTFVRSPAKSGCYASDRSALPDLAAVFATAADASAPPMARGRTAPIFRPRLAESALIDEETGTSGTPDHPWSAL